MPTTSPTACCRRSRWRHLSEGVRRLRDAGVQVVVGTCPDLGTIKPIAPPLKQVARAWSRRLAAAQTIAVVENGGRTVSLGSILGPEFAAAPALLFGPDQFHPSADGYRSLATVLLPSTLAALDLVPDDEARPEPFRGEGVLPIVTAAVRAANNPGTEVDGTEVAGSRRGVRGLWVELRHRRRHPQTEGEAPQRTAEGSLEAGEPAGPAGPGRPGLRARHHPGNDESPGRLPGLLIGHWPSVSAIDQSLLKIASSRSRFV